MLAVSAAVVLALVALAAYGVWRLHEYGNEMRSAENGHDLVWVVDAHLAQHPEDRDARFGTLTDRWLELRGEDRRWLIGRAVPDSGYGILDAASGEVLDAWGRPIRLALRGRADGGTDVRASSDGADGSPGTADDLVRDNTFFPVTRPTTAATTRPASSSSVP
ncbi:MAG TPA: hypothetical protein VF796_25755 [Humisphaera sp.]